MLPQVPVSGVGSACLRAHRIDRLHAVSMALPIYWELLGYLARIKLSELQPPLAASFVLQPGTVLTAFQYT
jgi:hypothetical protein